MESADRDKDDSERGIIKYRKENKMQLIESNVAINGYDYDIDLKLVNLIAVLSKTEATKHFLPLSLSLLPFHLAHSISFG